MKKTAKDDDLPDDLRCRRTDGRDWRCKQRVLAGKKLCHIHYLQGRKRQLKQKVPETLKLERKSKKKNPEDGKGIGDVGSSKSVRSSKKIVKKRKRCLSEVLDEALRKMKLKRGDLQLELIRGFLNRQVEKEKKKRKEREEEETELSVETELIRQLPNGIMNISQKRLDNVGLEESLDLKIGPGSGGSDSRVSVFQEQRSFRSKNIEPMPISIKKVVPFADKVRRKRKCHWCLRSNVQNLIKCSQCRKKFFCTDCIKQRHFETQEVKAVCPVCCKTCSCKICQRIQSPAMFNKDIYCGKNKADKDQLLRYLIRMLLPVLKQLNHNQRLELEIEAILTGRSLSAIKNEAQQAEKRSSNKSFCNNCNISLLDYHRSCSNCSYTLCLSCCWEYCRGNLCGDAQYSVLRQKYLSNDELRLKIKQIRSSCKSIGKMPIHWPVSLLNCEARPDGRICCPPADFGGCSDGILELRCLFPFTWMKELEVGAEELLKSSDSAEPSDASSCCSLCKEKDVKFGERSAFQIMAKGSDSNDNFLYSPTLKDLHEDKLEHFQLHWAKGHPIVVRNVFGGTSALCWDPLFIFCHFLENKCSRSRHEKQAISETTSLDWCEVETGSRQVFMGSSAEETHVNMRNRIMKIKAWVSSHVFQEQFPCHYDEIISALPLQEYVNPVSGLLNLALKLPKEAAKPGTGPSVHISVGSPEDFFQAGFLTKLCHESHDVVNFLAYATDVTISKEHHKKIKELMKKYKARCYGQSMSNSVSQKVKSSLQREGSGKSSLQEINGDKPPSQNGNFNGPFRSCNFRGRNSCPEDGTISHDSESISDSDSGASLLCSRNLQRNEQSDDECSLLNDVESITSLVDERISDSPAAQWDVFHREDVSKVLEYLRRHCNEFNSGYICKGDEIHTIHDQNFYLDAYHKMRLKEEFGVQPWTFEQKPGEAIIIPAGCPYQNRKLKSCVNVVVGFISPENAAESIRLTDEICLLPLHHKAREKVLEVRKMAVHGVKSALEDIKR